VRWSSGPKLGRSWPPCPATVRAVVDEMARLVERLEREAELLPKE
jgi:hypothetical protein